MKETRSKEKKLGEINVRGAADKKEIQKHLT